MPTVGSDKVSFYSVYRTTGDTFMPASAVPVGTTPTTSHVNNEEFPHGVKFTYAVKATFNDGTVSDYSTSRNATITAVNDAPIANNDSYSVNQDATLNVPAAGVLGNDTDLDSALPTDVPIAPLTAVLDVVPSHGALVLNADGSFTYTPTGGFVGTDSFTYKAKDVTPISARNVSATVTISVMDTKPPLVTLTIPPPNGGGGFFKTAPVAVGVSAHDPSSVSSFTCSDNGSPVVPGGLGGIGTPDASGSFNVSGDGTHSLVCTATDGLGNGPGAAPGSSNTGTVKIDTTPPTVTIAVPADNATYLLHQSVASSYSCSDPAPGSGIATCSGPVPNGSNINTSTVGPKTFTVTATDVAGNTTTKTNNYSVNYSVTQTPLKSSANQGSSVPVIFQVKDAPGSIISSLSIVLKIESVFNGAVPLTGCVSSDAGTRETLYSLPNGAEGGSSLQFVISSQSHQFNWNTKTTTTLPIITGKGCYTVLIYLDDRPDLTNPRMTTPVQLK